MEPTINIYNQDNGVEVMGRSCNMAGSGPKRNNQDAYSFATCMHHGKKYMVVIMCDGHSIHGDLFAQTASSELNRIVVEKLDDILKDPQGVLTSILATTNECLQVKYGRLNGGGTTATILIKTAGHEIVANLGDCDVYTRLQSPILTEEGEIPEIVHTLDGQKTTSEFHTNTSSKFFKLTEDHGGTSDAEVLRVATECPDCMLIYGTPTMNTNMAAVCKRDAANNIEIILDEKGKIKRVPYQTVPGVYANTVDMDIATYFVHVPSQKKLNIGRSLGDFGYHFVSVVPSVTELTYPIACPSTTIIGTDGYFNCVKKTEVCEELKKTPQEICDGSVDFVSNTFGCNGADNMTVVAIAM